MKLIIFLLLFNTNFAFSNSSVQKVYSSCRVVTDSGELLKCDQIEYSRSMHYAKFKNACLKNKKKHSYYKLAEGVSCPTNNLKYSCSSLPRTQTTDITSNYYYVIKNTEKLKTRCLHSFRVWNDYDLKSKDNQMLSQKVSEVSCLKVKDHKKFICENRKGLSSDELQRFYRNCQINHQKKLYYNFLVNEGCPKDEVKFKCKSKKENHKSIVYYDSYEVFPVSDLKRYCRSKQADWNKESLDPLDTTKIKSASCWVYSEKDNLLYCDEMSKTAKKSLVDFYKTCESIIGVKSSFKGNQKCSRKLVINACMGDDKFPRNRFLYQDLSSMKNRLKKQCLGMKLNWK